MALTNQKGGPFRWIEHGRYDRCKDLNPLQWHAQLTIRQSIAPFIIGNDEDRLLSISPECRADMLDAWEQLKSDPLPTDLWKFRIDHFGAHLVSKASSLRGVRPMTLSDMLRAEVHLEERLGKAALMQARAATRESFGRAISSQSCWEAWMNDPIALEGPDLGQAGLPFVDLAVRDDLLIEDFKLWLAEARERLRSDIEANTGRSARHVSEFSIGSGKQRLDTLEWATMGLLPCMDALLQCAQSNRKVTAPLIRALLRRDKKSDDAIRKTLLPRARSFLGADEDATRRMRELEVMAMNLVYR